MNSFIKKNLWKIVAISIAVIIFIVFYSKLRHVLNWQLIEKLKENWARLGIFGPMILVFIITVRTILPIFPVEFFELLSGYIYGGIYGALLCLFGVFLGSVVIYVIGKKHGEKILNKITKENTKNYKDLSQNKRLKALWSLLFVLPGPPKEILTYIMCIYGISFKKLLFFVVVLRFPAIISSTIVGEYANKGEFLISAIIYGICFLITLVGCYINKRIRDKRDRI